MERSPSLVGLVGIFHAESKTGLAPSKAHSSLFREGQRSTIRKHPHLLGKYTPLSEEHHLPAKTNHPFPPPPGTLLSWLPHRLEALCRELPRLKRGLWPLGWKIDGFGQPPWPNPHLDPLVGTRSQYPVCSKNPPITQSQLPTTENAPLLGSLRLKEKVPKKEAPKTLKGWTCPRRRRQVPIVQSWGAQRTKNCETRAPGSLASVLAPGSEQAVRAGQAAGR